MPPKKGNKREKHSKIADAVRVADVAEEAERDDHHENARRITHQKDRAAVQIAALKDDFPWVVCLQYPDDLTSEDLTFLSLATGVKVPAEGRKTAAKCSLCHKIIASMTPNGMKHHASTCKKQVAGAVKGQDSEVKSDVLNGAFHSAGVSVHQALVLVNELHPYLFTEKKLSSVPLTRTSFYGDYWQHVELRYHEMLDHIKQVIAKYRGCIHLLIDAGTSRSLGVHILCARVATPDGLHLLPLYVSRTEPGMAFTAQKLLVGLEWIAKQVSLSLKTDVGNIMCDNDSKNILAIDVLEFQKLEYKTYALSTENINFVFRDDVPLISADSYALLSEGSAIAVVQNSKLQKGCLAHIIKNTMTTVIKNEPSIADAVTSCGNTSSRTTRRVRADTPT
eukprot:PhM_4_TR2046/c2_g2_i1/m.46058